MALVIHLHIEKNDLPVHGLMEPPTTCMHAHIKKASSCSTMQTCMYGVSLKKVISSHPSLTSPSLSHSTTRQSVTRGERQHLHSHGEAMGDQWPACRR